MLESYLFFWHTVDILALVFVFFRFALVGLVIRTRVGAQANVRLAIKLFFEDAAAFVLDSGLTGSTGRDFTFFFFKINFLRCFVACWYLLTVHLAQIVVVVVIIRRKNAFINFVAHAVLVEVDTFTGFSWFRCRGDFHFCAFVVCVFRAWVCTQACVHLAIKCLLEHSFEAIVLDSVLTRRTGRKFTLFLFSFEAIQHCLWSQRAMQCAQVVPVAVIIDRERTFICGSAQAIPIVVNTVPFGRGWLFGCWLFGHWLVLRFARHRFVYTIYTGTALNGPRSVQQHALLDEMLYSVLCCSGYTFQNVVAFHAASV